VSLSIIVPVYNEEECIEECIRQLAAAFPGESFEIIFVNDGSADRTLKLLEENQGAYRFKLISYPDNRGYASAVHEGLKAATKDYFTIFDADLQVTPTDLMKMYQTAVSGNWDLVVGEPESKGYYLFRWVVSRGFNLIIRLLFNITIRDTNSPKIVRRSILEGVKLVYGHAMIDIEILAHAFKKKSTYTVVPFSLKQRFKGASKFNLMLIPRTLVDVIRLKIRLMQSDSVG